MKYLITFLCLLGCIFVQAQFGPPQIISTNADGAFRSIPFDVDNDGFIDVISASTLDSKIAWYKNTDGLGNFGPEQIIPTTFSPNILEMFDVDGDNMQDLVYKSGNTKIIWLKNIDGLGDFSGETIVTTNNYIYTFTLFDFNGNGSLDILAILYNSSFDERFVWYENLDGNGNFSAEHLISVGNYFNFNLALADLNNDGLQDIITSIDDGYSPSKIVWMENYGQGNYSAQQDIFEFQLLSAWMQVIGIFTADINGDGLNDLVINTHHDDLNVSGIYWLENMDGKGSFSLPKLIHLSDYVNGSNIRFYDLDNDTDLDILLPKSLANESIVWLKNNDGMGHFDSPQVIATQLQGQKDATAADINGSGFLDVISASAFDDTVAWYENQLLSTSDFDRTKWTLYPNPSSGMVFILENSEIQTVELYTNSGQKLTTHLFDDSLDISSFSNGIYFIKIINKLGNVQVSKLVKN